MGLKNYKLFTESASGEEYIMAIPSGEVIFVRIEVLSRMIDRGVVEWKHTVRNSQNEIVIVSCYCFEDKDIDLVTRYIEYVEEFALKNKRKEQSVEIKNWMNDYVKDDKPIKIDTIIQISKEYQEEFSKIFAGRKVNIGYLQNAGIQFYYAIFPDYTINKNYYASKKNQMEGVVRAMKMKYPNGVFTYVDKIRDDRIKYLREY